MSNKKQLWLLDGGNGAGKSTFYQLFLKKYSIIFVNADLIAKEISPDNAEEASYQAAHMGGFYRNKLLAEGISFCFETVFSHRSKIDFVAKAKSLGYQIILVYVHLENHTLNQARVLQRVSEGGHNVPADKIISRIPRTMENIRKVLPLVDQAYFLDNSSYSNPFRQVALFKQGTVAYLEPLPEWAKVILF